MLDEETVWRLDALDALAAFVVRVEQDTSLPMSLRWEANRVLWEIADATPPKQPEHRPCTGYCPICAVDATPAILPTSA